MEHPVPHPPGHRTGKRLITDERLRAELELCDRWGIPHSQFLGAAGKWTPRDRQKALAYQAYARSVCTQCGTRHDDWDHGGPDEEDAYVAVGQRCVGCQVIADKQADLAKALSEDEMRGMKVALIPVAVQAAAEAAREANRNTRD
ncbi:hypothetical protein GT036_33050 [Streptomyces sp. SID4915]|nr:hypothetical protein [Streptomyces sp. SID4915]